MKTNKRKILSISDHYLTLLQTKEVGAPLLRQVDIRGMKDEDIIKQLAGFVKTYKLTSQQIVAVIHRQNVLMRFLTLPSKDIQELKKMIGLQIATLVPYAPDDVVFDIKILNDTLTNQSKVMVVVAPKEIIARHWKIYTQAGLFPPSITLSSFGIWLWYSRRQLDKTGITMILDINDQDGEICICSHDHLFTSRSIRFPSMDLSADQFKFLRKEIDLTMDGYVQEGIGPLPTKFIITGSKPIPLDLLGTLNKEYELPVEDVDHARNIKGSMESVTALLGFTIGDLSKSVNLIPQEFLEAQVASAAKRAFRRMLAAGFLLILVAVGTYGFHVYHKNAMLEDLKDQWAQTKKQLDAIDKTKKRLEAMSAALNDRVVFADVFHVVQDAAPQGISLFNMNLSNDRVLTMQGIAPKQSDINTFQESLIRSALFANVRLDFVNKRTTQNAEVSYFKLSCKMK